MFVSLSSVDSVMVTEEVVLVWVTNKDVFYCPNCTSMYSWNCETFSMIQSCQFSGGGKERTFETVWWSEYVIFIKKGLGCNYKMMLFYTIVWRRGLDFVITALDFNTLASVLDTISQKKWRRKEKKVIFLTMNISRLAWRHWGHTYRERQIRQRHTHHTVWVLSPCCFSKDSFHGATSLLDHLDGNACGTFTGYNSRWGVLCIQVRSLLLTASCR